jgi:hypothetical protein
MLMGCAKSMINSIKYQRNIGKMGNETDTIK